MVLCKTDPRGWDTTPGEGEAQGTECTYAFVLQVVYQLRFLFVLEADRAPACSEESRSAVTHNSAHIYAERNCTQMCSGTKHVVAESKHDM